MPLNIYTSNRMENLADALATVVALPLSSPFTPETIVVQSKGMQRWVSMELARRFGVWANCSYPFPNSFVAKFFSRVLPGSADTAPFSAGAMTWQLFGLLPGFDAEPAFSPLHRYLADDRDDLKRYQLARKIADTFDQYTLYRAEMLHRWETTGPASADEAWQARLWKELCSGGGEHRGRLKERFCRLVGCAETDHDAFPERVSFFGISYLPAYHLEIIAAVARVIEVNLFLLSPTREYWADIVSSRALAGLAAEERELRFEGNPLLASLGKLGRDFSAMTVELGSLAAGEFDLYAEPAGDSLLCRLQADILNLSGAEEGREKRPLAGNDRSVQLHSCHSPMREAEVLHDQLLCLLEQEPGLEPRDILVMTPDIEAYAPYITAVFDGARDTKIPYSIADRRLTSEGAVASALISILALPGSRLTVVQLLDILSLAPVRRRFDLEEEDLATIREWLEATRVRWGLDEQDRVRLGLPSYRSNSWQAGLDRLLLGYAMSGGEGGLFNGILPYDDMEGATVQLLGRLIDFVSRVGQAANSLNRSHPLKAWSEKLHGLLAEFVHADDDTSRELAVVSGILEELATLAGEAGWHGDVTFAVIRAWLTSRLEQEEKGSGFMTGGVTFCAMLPMRSIPFRVIAMIGMNDGAFPRQNTPHGFDLIAKQWRPGDRSLRDEDRYLFLETLLSARSCLYISYTGQSMRDNSEIPPSVLVSELLDAVRRGFLSDDNSSVEQRLVTRHRLQAFSRDYFADGSPLFSYSAENFAALAGRESGSPPRTLFMPTPMAEPPEEWRDIPLVKLLRFFSNPAQFFAENRLGIRLGNTVAALEEREPFAVDGLDSYSLKTEILEALLNGEQPEALLPRVAGLGILPPACHGQRLFADHVEEAADFAEKIGDAIGSSAPLSYLDVDLAIGGFRLTGRLGQIGSDCMCRYRCAKIKARDQLKTWIEHLVLNAAQAEGYPVETLLIMTDRSLSFRKVEDSLAILGEILDLYWLGLTTPLPFFPESAMAYATGKTPWNLDNVRAKWEDGYNGMEGEGKNPYFRLCFGRTDPFDPQFERIARTLLEPLLRHKDKA